jgi:DNA repair protein RecO
MINKDEGIIVFSKNIKDNDLFIKVLSSKDKIVSGIVYGGNSSKKKLIYQIGYFIDYSLFQKNTNIPPTFKAEIIKPFISYIINDKYKSYSLLSVISLVNISIIEGQKVKDLYVSIKEIVEIIIKNKHWISFYCEWLFKLLKIIGYQIDYKNKKNYQFFNLINQEFEKINIQNSIRFPHHILEHSGKVNYVEVSNLFFIFENIYTKNHLDNVNYKMPINFINFKNLILNYLKENNHD